MAKDASKDVKQKEASAPKKTGNTTANKQRRISRQAKLAARPDDQVSENCLKKRQERRRNFTPEKRREATLAGERFQQNRDRRGSMLGAPDPTTIEKGD